MERIVKITPAFDKRSHESSKNFGIHDCEMFMVLKGEHGAVGLTISTGWFLPETQQWKEACIRRSGESKSWNGRGVAVFYCSKVKQHEWQEGRENCDWLGCTCYGDVGYSMSDTVFDLLIREGSEKVWEWLENYYNETFAKQHEQSPIIP